MSNPNQILLDLDAVRPEKEIFIKLDGQSHQLQPVTVDNFVANMQTMEKLGTGNLDAETEKKLISEMLHQVFPSVEQGRFGKLTMPQLNKLLDFTRKHTGEERVTAEAAANPPTAG